MNCSLNIGQLFNYCMFRLRNNRGCNVVLTLLPRSLNCEGNRNTQLAGCMHARHLNGLDLCPHGVCVHVWYDEYTHTLAHTLMLAVLIERTPCTVVNSGRTFRGGGSCGIVL